MAVNNNAESGFEKEVWNAADIMRGNMDAAEYKHVILGFIFLKYISDRFEHRYKALAEEGEGFEARALDKATGRTASQRHLFHHHAEV